MLTITRTNTARLRLCWAAAFLFAFSLAAGIAGRGSPSAQADDDSKGILRFDPEQEAMVTVDPKEAKAGYVYNHFSPRLNRRVWSIAQANGEFWYALGEGTTIPIRRLDIHITAEQGRELLSRRQPKLAEEIRRVGGTLLVRLNHDGKWELDANASFPTIFNAETGQRWEQFGDHYIPVRSSSGFVWTVQDGKYVPAGAAPSVEAAPSAAPTP